MKIVRFSIGGGTLLLSIVGLLICISGIVGVWMVAGRVEAVGNAVFATADESLDFVDAKVDRVKQALENSRQRIDGISRAAERLRDERADVKRESESLLQIVDEIFQQLKAAESWLDSCHAAASGVSRVSEAVVSSKYAASHEESTGIALAQRVQELSEQLAAALAKLQVMREELVQLRDTGKLAREVALRVVAYVADLDGKLSNISARLETLGTRVTQTRAACVDLGRSVDWWTIVVAVSITIFLAWFAISQIGMMNNGWRMMSRATCGPIKSPLQTKAVEGAET